MGLTAERVFGFSGVLGDQGETGACLGRNARTLQRALVNGAGAGRGLTAAASSPAPADRAANVSALSSALLVCMVGPWALCLLFFTALHWTFREDRRRTRQRWNGARGRAFHACIIACMRHGAARTIHRPASSPPLAAVPCLLLQRL